jgi:AGZA family xanthine/uracil permease-like MFS transporter
MDVFDTIGTLIGVSEQAGLIRNNRLPRVQRAMLSDAAGTTAGAVLGTSTVTSFIESATGVEHGGRTGLTSLTTAVLFLLALFFSPLIAMVGSYGPITAPALVIVGSMMIQNVRKVDWDDISEAIPAFLVMIGIPFSYSIGDGLAFGFISYPVIKLFSGKGREVKPLMYILAAVLLLYFVVIRSRVN